MKFGTTMCAFALVSLTACASDESGSEADDDAVLSEGAVEAPPVDDTTAVENTASASDTTIPDRPNPQVEIRPVRYGQDGPDLDSCGGYGEVTGLNPNGDNFLAVRASTNAGAYELDRLDPGQGVYMCDSDGDWIGIVYDKSGELDCGTGSPIPEARDYEGPCESGWVSKRFVTLMAG